MLNTLLLIAAFLASLIAVGFYRIIALRFSMLDVPNERSSHRTATPRGGGVGFIVVWFALMLYLLPAMPWPSTLGLLIGAFAVATIGFIDDRYHVSAAVRAAVHLAASGVAVLPFLLQGLGSNPYGTLLAAGFAVFAIAWSVNMFNFMDGTDGIAAVEALFVFGFGGLFIWMREPGALASSCFLVAASVAGFLSWNYPQAKIFMGDAGSGFLGFLIGAVAVAAYKLYQVPLLVWVILYSLFCFDASVTLIRRMLGGERWYAAHRSHAYQRLHHGAKWSHKSVLRGAIGVNAVLAALAALGNAHQELLPVLLVLTILLHASLYLWIERAAPFERSATKIAMPAP